MAFHPRWSLSLPGSRSDLEAGGHPELWLSGWFTAVALKSTQQRPGLFFLWETSVTWAEEQRSMPSTFGRDEEQGDFLQGRLKVLLVSLKAWWWAPDFWTSSIHPSGIEGADGARAAVDTAIRGLVRSPRPLDARCGSVLEHVSQCPRAAHHRSSWSCVLWMILSLNPDWFFHHQHANEWLQTCTQAEGKQSSDSPRQLRRAGPQLGAWK